MVWCHTIAIDKDRSIVPRQHLPLNITNTVLFGVMGVGRGIWCCVVWRVVWCVGVCSVYCVLVVVLIVWCGVGCGVIPSRSMNMDSKHSRELCGCHCGWIVDCCVVCGVGRVLCGVIPSRSMKMDPLCLGKSHLPLNIAANMLLGSRSVSVVRVVTNFTPPTLSDTTLELLLELLEFGVLVLELLGVISE